MEVEFAFEGYSLPMGRIKKGETVTKVANLLIKDMEKTKITDIQSTSEFVKFKQMDPIAGDNDYTKIPLEVKIVPGLTPGRFRETVTVYSNLEAIPRAQLVLNGTIEGDVVIKPESIKFMVYDSAEAKNQTIQTFSIKYNSNEQPLEIVNIREKDNRLDIELDTVEYGSEYEISATLKDDYLNLKGNRSGYIILDTNDPVQQTIKVLYQITHRRR